MKNDRIKMTVVMEVTEPQALALQAMFKYWDWLAGIGSSRFVGFYVDGDGNFKPKTSISYSAPIRTLTPEMEYVAIVEDEDGDRKYDFDPVAWMINQPTLK